MSTKILIPLFALAILLSACSTSVVTEEDRELPTDTMEGMQDEGFTGEKTADPATSFIAFVGTRGETTSHECKFNQFTTSVEFTDGVPESINATIAIQSLETESDGLTRHLLSADFFEAETFSEAVFSSTSVTPADAPDTYTVTGVFTIKDVSQEETFTATITQEYLQASHTLDRTDYNVGGPIDGLKATNAEVPLELKILFQ